MSTSKPTHILVSVDDIERLLRLLDQHPQVRRIQVGDVVIESSPPQPKPDQQPPITDEDAFAAAPAHVQDRFLRDAFSRIPR